MPLWANFCVRTKFLLDSITHTVSLSVSVPMTHTFNLDLYSYLFQVFFFRIPFFFFNQNHIGFTARTKADLEIRVMYSLLFLLFSHSYQKAMAAISASHKHASYFVHGQFWPPDVVFPPLPMSALSSSPFLCALQDSFGQTWWTGNMTIPLQFASLLARTSSLVTWSLYEICSTLR